VGRMLAVHTMQRLYMWVEVTGSNPVDSNKILNKQPIIWCHVAAHDWATWHRTTNHNLPCVAIPFIQLCQLCHSALPRVVRTATSAAVRTVQSASFFLPVCHFEQNAISLAPDVRLSPNELRWVRNDEAYALVRFEVIPSTLNF
jgi:hypothetical protein